MLLLNSKGVNRKNSKNKEKIISILRERLEEGAETNGLPIEKYADPQVALLLDELQIFQLELEMQNDELSASYQLLEKERARFAGFFNLAPVGYFILDHLGLVEEANQTGANLLNISRDDIVEVRFQSFIAPEMWDLFYAFLYKMQSTFDKQNCEIKLVFSDNREIFTHMEGIAIVNVITNKLQYYITVIDITENRIAQQKLREQEKLILAVTLNAQERERYKISNALHDSVCQLLYGIRLNLQNIRCNSNLKEEFKNVNQLLDQAIRETRELSYELTPSILRDFGFTAGIKEMVQRLSTPDFEITTAVKTTTDLLHKDIQLYVFRIIQELINNCIKHSGASRAKILMCTEGQWINLQVIDNGTGFDVEKSLSKGSGIRGIRNRALLLNGHMNIETSDKGTSIHLKFKNAPELLCLNL